MLYPARVGKEGEDMTKTTIELHRQPGFTPGYGYMNRPFSDNSYSTLDALAEWTMSTPCRIYRHLLREVDENVRVDGKTCDRVFYLDIYHQPL